VNPGEIMPKRRHFTASQKAAIVLEVLKEEKTIAQIASENNIHPNQIYKWKTQALENFAGLFEEDRKGEKAQAAAHEKQVTELYTEIGKLSTQLNWLKKKSGLPFE
jgi:putative transposase